MPPTTEPKANNKVELSDEAEPIFFENKLMKCPADAGEIAPAQVIRMEMPNITCHSGGSLNRQSNTMPAAESNCAKFTQ